MNNVKQILCFGDSLTEGWINGGKAFHPYTKKLKVLLQEQTQECNVMNFGFSGERVSEMNVRLQKVLSDSVIVDLLILQGGTNDILLSLELRDKIKLIDEFQKLFVTAKENHVKKICLLTTMEGYFTENDGAVMSHEESNKYRVELNEELRKFSQKNTDFILLCDMDKELPLFSLTSSQREYFWDDFIHPSIAGYDKMGEIVFEHVKKIF